VDIVWRAKVNIPVLTSPHLGREMTAENKEELSPAPEQGEQARGRPLEGQGCSKGREVLWNKLTS
jgi:hypothetical protein